MGPGLVGQEHRLILDSGAVIGYSRGHRKVVALLTEAARRGRDVVVPPVVLTQTLRGGARDTPIYRLLGGCTVPLVDQRIARLAGELLGRTGGSDVADAQIAAEAVDGPSCAILTGDMADLTELVGSHAHVKVVDLDTL